MYMLVFVEEVNEKNKRFKAYFSDGTITKFGQTGSRTFIDHGDNKLKSNYLKRHIKDLLTNDYRRSGYLSIFITWNKPTLKESITDFNRRIIKNDWNIKSNNIYI